MPMGPIALGVYQRASFDLVISSEAIDEAKAQEKIRCIPDLVRFNAVNNPDHVFCLQSKQVSKSAVSSFEFTHITYLQLAQAVDRCCDWILSNAPGALVAQLAQDGSIYKSAPIALFMESDVGLFVYMVALLTLNIPCLLLSIRLSPSAICHLVNETSAGSIITSSRMLSTAHNAFSQEGNTEKMDIPIIPAVSYEDFIHSEIPSDQPLQRLRRSREIIRESDRNVFILHSSGTTGLPKAIPLTHRYLLGYAACHLFPPNEDEYIRGINLSTLPLYHGFGALAPCLSLSVGKTVCFPPASTIPTDSLIVRLLEAQKMTSLMTVPNIMEEMTLLKDFPAFSCYLADLDFVAVGGGGMKPAVAQILHKSGIKLLNHFGATELGALAPIFRPEEDYDYRFLRLRTDLGLRLKFQGGEPSTGSSEALTCKLLGYPFGWDSEFELQDVLENNPLRPISEVRILGRNDDVVVLATGEKVMPNLLEQTIETHPLIKTAVAVGQGHFEIGLIIEPTFQPSNDIDFVNEIWPHIESANTGMDRHARISTKASVVVKSATKEIPRTDKGSVRRREVYEVFEEEIQVLYGSLDLQLDHGPAPGLDFVDLKSGIRNIVTTCLPEHIRKTSFGDDDDLINLGLDSLQATRLLRLLKASLISSQQHENRLIDLSNDFVYSNPSISRLATALEYPNTLQERMSKRENDMKGMVEKYATYSPKRNDTVVLLTGATGNLGAHLLQVLSETPMVKRILCLSRFRSSSATSTPQETLRSRQRYVLDKMGIMISESGWSKIEHLCWDASAESFGLSGPEYEKLAVTVSHIFHGAWPMDFRRSLISFEAHIKAVGDFIQLGRDIHRTRPHCRPRVVLASSIAVVGRYAPTVVPEQTTADPDTPLPMGYAEAKWVCEKIFESAFIGLKDEIEPRIVRIGQLSGSQLTGFWTTQEHVAALIKASQSLGAMPDLVGTLSWLPVDRAARVISQLLLRPLPEKLFFHVENPVRQPWSDAITIIERKLGILSANRLPFITWLKQAMDKDAINPNLLNFLKNHFLHMSGGGIVLDTKNSRTVSPTLKASGAVEMDTINLYIDYWRSIDYLT